MIFIMELFLNVLYFILALFLPSKIRTTNIEMTRKISHMLCGSWIFIYEFINKYYLTNIIIMIFMIVLMSISYKYNIFRSVERANQVKSYGTVYFFVAFLVFIIYIKLYNLNSEVYIIYMLPLIYGDAFAAIIGKKFNWIEYKIFNNIKSVSGNISMMLVSLLVTILYNFFALNNYYSITYLLLISIIASIMEAISIKGTDNFTIPIFTMIIMEAMLWAK